MFITLFKKKTKDIDIAKRYKQDIIRHQINPLFLKFNLFIKNCRTEIFSKHSTIILTFTA